MNQKDGNDCKDNKDLDSCIDLSVLNLIANFLDEGILVSDKSGKIIIYNDAMEKLENKKSDEMLGKFLWDAYGYKDKSTSEHKRVLETNRPILKSYNAHITIGGQPQYVSYSTYPIFHEDETVGVISICNNEKNLRQLLNETFEKKREFNKLNTSRMTKHYNPNGTAYTFADIVGSSLQMKTIIKQSQTIAWLDNNIMIIGETGTGKEVLAQSIHNFGKNSREPFVALNCSAIPENLLESILFGCVKGAYTGAVEHGGLIEEAKRGTLFLDELNAMPFNMQAKLLRVIQEKQYRRVGGNELYRLNCRVVSALNESPLELVERGMLREDLYYRLAGFNIYIPPLRERPDDTIELAEFFLRRYSAALNKNIFGMSSEVKRLITHYTWPGNIRQLEHLIENMLVLADGRESFLRLEHIPAYFNQVFKRAGINRADEGLPGQIDRVEREMIIEALQKHNYNITHTARQLDISRQSLLYKMKKHHIDKI